jgi:diaminopropionate ammonia-lyase
MSSPPQAPNERSQPMGPIDSFEQMAQAGSPERARAAGRDEIRFLYRRRQKDTAVHPRRGVDPPRFHRAMAGYDPTPLTHLPRLAAALGVEAVRVKVEVSRLGLPSFKILGASWATITALRPLLPPWWTPGHGLRPLAGHLPDLTLVAATEGNHGHALARVAAWLGLRCRVYVPETMSQTRRQSIQDEGAAVIPVEGTYDDAVARSASDGTNDGSVLVSDTSWPGYELVPEAAIAGYSTILGELQDQLASCGARDPDLVLVQLGVGSFGAAVARHFAGSPTRIVGVEPTQAACVMASLAAGRRVRVPGRHDSVMVGLNCGTPSYVAWPTLVGGLDSVIALGDQWALSGVKTLADEGIDAGPCAGVAAAAARELLAGPEADIHRALLHVRRDASVLLFATEGPTSDLDDGAGLTEPSDAPIIQRAVSAPSQADLERRLG